MKLKTSTASSLKTQPKQITLLKHLAVMSHMRKSGKQRHTCQNSMLKYSWLNFVFFIFRVSL